MTAAPRLDVLLSLWLLLSLILNEALATPHSLHAANIYARKVDPVISYSSNGSVSVLDPTTEEPIPQGPGTDGSGSNFSLPAVIWLVFLLVIGVPLAVAGIRGWRCTTGVAIGLVAIVCCESHEPHRVQTSNEHDCEYSLDRHHQFCQPRGNLRHSNSYRRPRIWLSWPDSGCL